MHDYGATDNSDRTADRNKMTNTIRTTALNEVHEAAHAPTYPRPYSCYRKEAVIHKLHEAATNKCSESRKTDEASTKRIGNRQGDDNKEEQRDDRQDEP